MRKFLNMDCMEGMKRYPDNHFNLAIVDPPYGLGTTEFKTAIQRAIHKKKSWNNSTPTAEYFLELHRVSKNQIIWGCNYYAEYIAGKGRIIHNKLLTPYVKNGGNFSDCDLASHSFGKNIVLFEYQWCGNVQNGKINWKNVGLDARIHPTQKPIALYCWLLENYAKEGDLILDTHVGSASSLIACEALGFDYVGFEIDKDYFEAAKKRIKDWRSLPLFDEKKKEPEQTKLAI